MPAIPPDASKLFHPKAKKKGDPKSKPSNSSKLNKSLPSSSKPSPPKESPTPQPPAVEFPEGEFTEFRLVSSALNGWKYDVMKFESRKQVDILTWTRPVKLNRKDLRRVDPAADEEATGQVAVRPMVGPDGKPVIGMDGRVVMLDAEGKPIHKEGSANPKPKAPGKKRPGKKTRQVFKVPDEIRQLRKEERYPWVMEDSSGQEVWVAQLQDVGKADTHAFFMPASNNTFKFVPAHRWYKFQKRPNYAIPTLDRAEKLMAEINKNKDPGRWLLHKNKNVSEDTLKLFKKEQEGAGPSTSIGNASAPNGRRLKVKQEMNEDLFGDDDTGSKRRSRNDMDADYDEVPYEEEFQDDEEKIDLYEDDELTKEMEDRLNREYMKANKERDGHVVESDEEEPEQKLTGVGKSMRRLVHRHEKNDAYDSDDEDANPYASEEETEEEEEEEPNEPVNKSPSRAGSQPPTAPPSSSSSATPSNGSRPNNGTASAGGSRQTSPAPAQSGHSYMAQRATSPKPPKPKVNPGSRLGSPLAQEARSGTPSPSPNSQANGAKSNKRKAEDDGTMPSPAASTNSEPRPKKRRPAPAVDANGNPIELTDQMVIDWLRTTENATTRDCITHFTPFLRDKTAKDNFTKLIKEVASLKGGVLALRSQYRNGYKKANPVPVSSGLGSQGMDTSP